MQPSTPSPVADTGVAIGAQTVPRNRRLLVVATVAPMIRSFLLPFAEHFRELGWRVDAMAQGVSECGSCRSAFDHVWEMPWSRSPLDPRNWRGPPRAIRQIVNEHQYDLVHVHSPVAAFVTRYALRRERTRRPLGVVYTAHGFHFHRYGHPLKNRLFSSLERMAGRWTDELVVMNREDQQAAQRLALVPPGHLTYMPGIGVDLEQYSANHITDVQIQRVRDELGASSGDQILLSVAEFIPRKRHADLLKAVAQLKRGNVQLWLAGDGALLEQTIQLARDLGIEHQVRFLGRRDDIAVLMRCASACILPSVQEGLPRVVMEAMCLGTPVVGSQIRGTEELLEGDCGLLFPVGDIKQLAAHIDWILDHPDDARQMAQRARQRIADYSIGQIIQLHEQLYARALQHVEKRQL